MKVTLTLHEASKPARRRKGVRCPIPELGRRVICEEGRGPSSLVSAIFRVLRWFGYRMY